jgi:hypothetical protein
MDHKPDRHGPSDRRASDPDVPDLAKFFEERTTRQDSTAQQAPPPSAVGTEDALTTPSSSSGDENERPRPVPEDEGGASRLSGSVEAPSSAPKCDAPTDPLVALSANVQRTRRGPEANILSGSVPPTAHGPTVVRTQTGGWIRTNSLTQESEQAMVDQDGSEAIQVTAQAIREIEEATAEQDGPGSMQVITEAAGQDPNEEWHNRTGRRVSTERFVLDIRERQANATNARQRPGQGEVPDESDRRPPPRLPDLPPADSTRTSSRCASGQTGLYTPVQPVQVSHSLT